MTNKAGRYILSLLYFIPLYFFWIGVFPVIFGLKSSGINYAGAGAFALGLIFPFIIANISEKRGISWWKIFLISGFLSTGIPIIGIVWLIILKIKKEGIKGNSKINIGEIKNIDYKTILNENGMGEYIVLFEKNKLNELDLIIDLSENDYEKLGIELMGDRKRLLKLFSKENIYKNIEIKTNEKTEENVNYLPGMTKILINRNCEYASAIAINIFIDGVNKFVIYNNSSEIIEVENGVHCIKANIDYFSKCNEIKFVAIGNEIIFNIIPMRNDIINIENVNK
jgi:hypothetical protein